MMSLVAPPTLHQYVRMWISAYKDVSPRRNAAFQDVTMQIAEPITGGWWTRWSDQPLYATCVMYTTQPTTQISKYSATEEKH